MSKAGRGGLDPEALDYYSDGAWYDAEYVHIGGDIPYYKQVASETVGPILELACGTGRLTIPMAEAAQDGVTGVDLMPSMIARAEEKRVQHKLESKLRFVVDDMRSLRLNQRFSAVILAFNTLMHMLEDADLEAVLETARVHLAEGGTFHLDLHTPYPNLMSERDPRGRYDPQQMIDPRTQQRWVVTENNQYDPRTQINTMRFYYRRTDARGRPSGPEREVCLRLRVIFPRELDRWLHSAGFRIVGDFDDLGRSIPFTGKGGRRVLMVKAR
ncbi:MAG: class I SAM-dependent methyltransferase [Myxococcota bacterium]